MERDIRWMGERRKRTVRADNGKRRNALGDGKRGERGDIEKKHPSSMIFQLESTLSSSRGCRVFLLFLAFSKEEKSGYKVESMPCLHLRSPIIAVLASPALTAFRERC